MHISNWSARRSGASMTIVGKIQNETDASEVKLSNIKLIEARGRLVVAITNEGYEHILEVTN